MKKLLLILLCASSMMYARKITVACQAKNPHLYGSKTVTYAKLECQASTNCRALCQKYYKDFFNPRQVQLSVALPSKKHTDA